MPADDGVFGDFVRPDTGKFDVPAEPNQLNDSLIAEKFPSDVPVCGVLRPTMQSGHFAVANANFRLKRPSSSTRVLSRIAVFDVVWMGVSPLGAFFLRDTDIVYRSGSVVAYCTIAFFCSIVVFQWFNTSAPIARFFSVSDARELFKACVIIAALSASLSFLFTRLDAAPRSVPILHFILLTSGLFAARMLWRLREMRREVRGQSATAFTQQALIVGATRSAWFFSKMLEELAPGQYQIVAILDERPKMQHRSLNGYPIIGTPLNLNKIIDEYAMHGVTIDKVFLAARQEELSKAAGAQLLQTCSARSIDLEVLPDLLIPGFSVSGRESANGKAPLRKGPLAFEPHGLQSENHHPFWKFKRAIDFTIALGLVVVLTPVIIAVVFLAFVDVGMPVVFWQQRVGRNRDPLYLYKFRTLQTLFDGRTQQKRDAQYPSAIGRFLRASRLDELPQLWNILAGDMSLIGPRPLLPIDQPHDSSFRLSVRPGITGWAQVCGGKLVSPVEKNALDEWYIRNASLKLDAIIALRTVWMILSGDRRDERAIAIARSNEINSQPEMRPRAA